MVPFFHCQTKRFRERLKRSVRKENDQIDFSKISERREGAGGRVIRSDSLNLPESGQSLNLLDVTMYSRRMR